MLASQAYTETLRDSGGTPAFESAEASLELSWAERRRGQMGLAAEGFDPRPANGLFGRRTREAIRAWQAARGEATTGWLDANAAKALLVAGERSDPKCGSVEGGGSAAGNQILRDKSFWA